MANAATNIFPVGNIAPKGIVVCMVAGSFAASLWLTNNRVVPVSNMAGIANLWVWTDKYNRLCYIFALLNCELSAFPTYLMSADYISFPVPSQSLCQYYLALPFYYWVVASSKVFTCCIVAYVVLLDSTWQYVLSSHNYNTSVLIAD